MKTLREIRIELLHGMNDYILKMGDEDIEWRWFTNGIPNCPDEEDFEYFADDDLEWKWICGFFGQLVSED